MRHHKGNAGQPTFLGMSHSPSNAKGSQMSGDTQMSGDVVSYLARSFMDERGAAILTTVVVVAVIATFLVNLIRRIRDKD